MEQDDLFIDGKWQPGHGDAFTSTNPATEDMLWQGGAANALDVDDAVKSARAAFPDWSNRSFEHRLEIVHRFKSLLTERKEQLAEIISQENGKPFWDALGEVSAMINKIDISANAYNERTPTKINEVAGGRTALRHRAHGVLAVYGPFNFPGHLPNGHIVPALLAGNTLIFKPSELTPLAAQAVVRCWETAGLPNGVLNLVQGARETGEVLSRHGDIDGLLFTGSASVGRLLHEEFGGQTEKILALELGGNNPLIVWDTDQYEAAALMIVQSAYVTSGQRCTCARRLIVPEGKAGNQIVEALLARMETIRVGAFTESPEPYMGPVITNAAADKILVQQQALLASSGKALRKSERSQEGIPFLTPGLIEVDTSQARPDEEIFGPLLQVLRVPTFEQAIEQANATRFGLAAGLLSDDAALYQQFLTRIRAGIVNWNKPLTGASSAAPFGGIGLSGNHRPSAYYAADYCAYPMASMESDVLALPDQKIPGLS